MTRTCLILAAGLALASPSFTQAQPAAPVVNRDSTGARRAELDKMELKDFPADAWAKLTGWTNPSGEAAEPVSASTYDGRPVLIFTWASWHPASQRALASAQQLADKYSAQGLLVVGIHHPTGFDKSADLLKSRNITFLQAHDATGDFRKALKIDHEPDFYIIDRAGRLRYAAVSSASLDAACSELAKETREQASDLPRILRERADQEAAAKGRFTDINQGIALSKLPEVPPGYVAPGEDAYQKVTWPKMNRELGKELGMIDQQTNKQKEPALNFTPEGYYPAEPNKSGRATVIYFWHAEEHRSFNPVMQKMDILQQQYPRDLVVIGAMVPLSALDPSFQQQSGNKEEDQEKLMKKYQTFLKSRTFHHTLAADLTGSSVMSINGAQGGVQKFPLPGAMVVSSDGVIRWVGWSDTSDFKYAIDTVLANDPAVLARRAADRKFIETSTKK
jgi:hypothetical protein